MSVLTLIRAKEEDSGNYTMRVENGDHSRTVGLILEVKGQYGPVITFHLLRSLSFSRMHGGAAYRSCPVEEF